MNYVGAKTWIYSNGGPLILLPRSHMASWLGTDCNAEDAPDFKSDYERACEIDELLAILQIGEVEGLILGDEPLQTTWIPFADETGGTFVRWDFASDEASALHAACKAPDAQFTPEKFELTVVEHSLCLFDSGCAGCRVVDDECLHISLTPGRYGIQTVIHEPDRETRLWLHRLTMRV